MEWITVKRGAVRIGRSGKKLHPAIIGKWSHQDDIKPYLRIECSCGGTANGQAAHKAVFIENGQPTCRVTR